jgi:radical SAM protein with 4Fe4S-binding SPASM domain
MDLIIKPTELCNFKCTFCSSTKITAHSASATQILDLEKVFQFLKRFPETSTIIVNGGDPLMVPPQYYWQLIDHLDKHEYKATISFTSNLWPFLKNPKKWTKLFQHERMGVTTSFNYGPGRVKGDLTLFTEQDLWDVSNAMLDHVGYRPDFISVVTDENEHLAIQNVELAKRMSDDKPAFVDKTTGIKQGVECKLNYAMASGDVIVDSRTGHKMGQADNPYLLSKIYKIYVEINKLGLTDWEFNTKQMIKRLSGNATICPQNRKCDEGIRTIQPGGDYYSCGAFGDDRDKPIDFTEEVINGNFFTPLQDDYQLDAMKTECYSCPMFAICNGCRKTVKDLKQANLVAQHCGLMKTLASDILEANGL